MTDLVPHPITEWRISGKLTIIGHYYANDAPQAALTKRKAVIYCSRSHRCCRPTHQEDTQEIRDDSKFARCIQSKSNTVRTYIMHTFSTAEPSNLHSNRYGCNSMRLALFTEIVKNISCKLWPHTRNKIQSGKVNDCIYFPKKPGKSAMFTLYLICFFDC